MKDLSNSHTKRELWMTPSVQHFLRQYGITDSAKELSEDILRALDGRDEKNGCIRLSSPGFLVFIIDATEPEGRERVIVWHGPSDGGVFFNERILQKAVLTSTDFV